MIVNNVRRELQEEALKAIENNGYNAWCLIPTGGGKSYVMVEVLKKLNPEGRIWYLCDSTENRDVTFKEELKKWGAEDFIDRIEFMCFQTAYKLKRQNVELLLADEADAAMTKAYSKAFLNNNFKYKLLVTATLADDKRKIAEEIAPIVFEKHLEDIEGKGVLNETEYYFVNYMLSKDENFEYLNYNSKFAKLLSDRKRGSWGDERLTMLQIQRKQWLSKLRSSRDVCRRLLTELYSNEDNKILIFCGLSEQADKICKHSYHSKSEESYLESFDKGNIRVMSCVGKIDRGVNIKGVNNIIFEAPTRSKTKFSQRSGRGRRLKIAEKLKVFFLIPHYKKRFGGDIAPSCVLDWVLTSMKGLNANIKTYKLK